MTQRRLGFCVEVIHDPEHPSLLTLCEAGIPAWAVALWRQSNRILVDPASPHGPRFLMGDPVRVEEMGMEPVLDELKGATKAIKVHRGPLKVANHFLRVAWFPEGGDETRVSWWQNRVKLQPSHGVSSETSSRLCTLR